MSFWREALGLPPQKKYQKRHWNGRNVYSAAALDRLTWAFKGSDGSADADMKNDFITIRKRCREVARDDAYVKRYLELCDNNVVGRQGFKLQCKAVNDFDENRPDETGNAIVEEAWATFGQLGNCTADGRSSMVDLQKAIGRAYHRDGEAVIQIVRNRRFKHGIAFHLIEADQIDEDKVGRVGENEIRMGVEVDRFQKPVAYWIKERHPGDKEMGHGREARSTRVPAENIIHVYKQDRPGQTRGVSELSVVLTHIKHLNAHREAELVAARMNAAKMGIITSPAGEEFPADGYEDAQQQIPYIDAEPGTFHSLPPGFDIQAFDVKHPSTAFAEFQKAVLRSFASALSVSYASLTGDLSDTSYSSVRQGALEERDNYQNKQQFLCDHAIKPLYAVWLAHVMSFGIINLPITRFDKFYNATEFKGRGWSWVDPLKEIQAAKVGMHMGVMSPQIVAAQYGNDWEEILSDWSRAKADAERMGVEISYEPFGAPDSNKPVEEQGPPQDE